MSTVLLATKLHIPRRRPGDVTRPHLIERLRSGLDQGHVLTLVSAPAGYGKTSLVAAWLEELGRPAAWLTLDESDNDPIRFFAYLIAALRTARPDVGDANDASLAATSMPPLETVLAPLLNELAADPRQLVVVLDDYHLVQTRSIHETVSFLLDYLPPQVHLVIASRSDPALPLARLHGRGLVTELRLADLRFSREEAGQFLQNTLGWELPADEIAILARCGRKAGQPDCKWPRCRYEGSPVQAPSSVPLTVATASCLTS